MLSTVTSAVSSTLSCFPSTNCVRTTGASRRVYFVEKNVMSFQMPVLRSRMPSENVKSQPTDISIVTFLPMSPSPPLRHSPFDAPQFFWRGSPG